MIDRNILKLIKLKRNNIADEIIKHKGAVSPGLCLIISTVMPYPDINQWNACELLMNTFFFGVGFKEEYYGAITKYPSGQNIEHRLMLLAILCEMGDKI